VIEQGSARCLDEPVEAVIFDWGGTLSEWVLIEMEDMWELAAEHIAVETGGEPQAIKTQLALVENRLWEECVGFSGARSFRLVDIFKVASDELGVDVAEAVLEEAALRHLDSWTEHVVHDAEAKTTLASLKARGIRTGLLSNTHWPEHFHEHFLQRDGLAEFLDICVYSSNEPEMKPHPRIFQRVLAELDVRPERTLFVGDRQHDDIRGAQGVGMRGVWKHTPHAFRAEGVTPDFVITALPDVLDICAGVNGGRPEGAQ